VVVWVMGAALVLGQPRLSCQHRLSGAEEVAGCEAVRDGRKPRSVSGPPPRRYGEGHERAQPMFMRWHSSTLAHVVCRSAEKATE